MEDVEDWDLVVPIFVWSIRTTAKLYNGTFTPYEIITGLKPRSPMDAVLASGVEVERISTDAYVTQLVKYLKWVHQHVDQQHELLREEQRRASYRQFGEGVSLGIGDHVLVARQPEPGVSVRFQRGYFDDIYQIVEAHGEGRSAKAFTLCDLRGNRTGLGFIQPVAYERLKPVAILPLAQPVADQRTRISLRVNGQDREGNVVNQYIDGRVTVKFDDLEEPQEFDLATQSYHWLVPQ